MMYLNDWKESGFIGMVADFEGIFMSKAEFEAEACPWNNEGMWAENKRRLAEAIESDRYKGIDVLLASYTYKDYSGCAFVLFRKDGELYEVNGSHCSCYGLGESDYCGDSRTQWKPEATTAEALRRRLEHDTYEFDGMRDELRQILDSLQ